MRSIPAWAGETGPGHKSPRRCQVYPRVGGGNQAGKRAVAGSPGLSPRGRGKPMAVPPFTSVLRSIPAWAGETASVAIPSPPAAVYPRVGGGNGRSALPRALQPGLSPRGRGKRRRRAWPWICKGSIPAWAGETKGFAVWMIMSSVYPRVGGGNAPRSPAAEDIQGLSPRGRGKLNL